jgi:hypothetical protein
MQVVVSCAKIQGNYIHLLKKNIMKKGIVIYALGHTNYYRMAENLAASLVANGARDRGIRICIICDSKEKLVYPHLFDDFVLLDTDKFMQNGKVVFNNATVLVYELSPYATTIKLDADMIWIEGRNPSLLFNELNEVDITFSNRGYGWNKGNSVWAHEHEIMKEYKLSKKDKLYKIYGEFLYFKKNKTIASYFKKVKEIYNSPKVFCHDFANGSMTDELAFQIACMLTKIYPHQDDFTPVYNRFLGYDNLLRKYPFELEGYYGYSIGGNITDAFQKNNYNILAKHYFAKLGLSNPYQVEDKRTFLPERMKL